MEAQTLVVAILELGATQAQIEEKTKIPQPTVSRIKRGLSGSDVRLSSFRALEALHAQLVAEKQARESQEAQQAGPATAGA